MIRPSRPWLLATALLWTVGCSTVPTVPEEETGPDPFEDQVSEVDLSKTPEIPAGGHPATPDINPRAATPTVPPPATEVAEDTAAEDDSGSLVDAALSTEALERQKEAEAEARRAAEEARRNRTPGLQAFENGVMFAQQGNPALAAKSFEESVEADPELKWGWYNLGLLREREEKTREAEKAYRMALQADGAFEEAAGNLTRLLIRTGRMDQAERELRARIAKHPSALGLRNHLGQVLIEKGGADDLDAAFTEARKVLKADERNVGAMVVLGQVFYAQKKYELAANVLDNAIKVEPGCAEAHNIRGFVYMTQKDRESARQSFKTASELRDDLPEAHVNYGAFLNQAQDFEKAVKALELAVQYAPRMPEAHLNLGNAYRGAGNHVRALTEYELVRKLEPKNNRVLFNLGLLHLDAELPNMETLARLEKAKAYFEQFEKGGGEDQRLDDFMKHAENAISRETRRIEREKKKALKAAKEAAERKERDASSSRLGDEEDEDEDEPAAPVGAGTTLGDDDEDEK